MSSIQLDVKYKLDVKYTLDAKYTGGCNGTSKALAKGRALNLLLLTRINIKKKRLPTKRMKMRNICKTVLY